MLIFNHNRETKYFLKQYTSNLMRIYCIKSCRIQGLEEIFQKGKLENKKVLEKNSEICSLSRAKRNIRELALCNNFTHFATITISSSSCDRFSLDACQKLLKRKLHTLKQYNKDFGYIFITEKHKNGAFHFHGLVKGISFYKNENGFLSNKTLDKIGFNSFSPIKDYVKVSNYITKYITKDCVKNSTGRVYINSLGLSKALKYEIKPISLNWGYENDFVKIKDINLSTITKTELKNLFFIEEN